VDLGIAGKRALVAAGTAGLGLATVDALLEAGVRVAVCGRDPDRLAEVVDTRRGELIPLVADVGTVAGATAFVTQGIEALGGVDILVTNAGGPPPGTFTSTDVEAYRPALELNLMSVVAMCKAAVPTMVAQGWGRVVAITSVTVRQPIEFLILSNTARAGATGFLKTLALEVAQHGVTVNSIQPGYHATDRLSTLPQDKLDGILADIPAGRLGDPRSFGDVMAFLCSESAGFITGAAIPVDGGSYRGLL
jgi:3-oxoacyl-[acyl-carrier protein] reductase